MKTFRKTLRVEPVENKLAEYKSCQQDGRY